MTDKDQPASICTEHWLYFKDGHPSVNHVLGEPLWMKELLGSEYSPFSAFLGSVRPGWHLRIKISVELVE